MVLAMLKVVVMMLNVGGGGDGVGDDVGGGSDDVGNVGGGGDDVECWRWW